LEHARHVRLYRVTELLRKLLLHLQQTAGAVQQTG
jgi:hypothetical protein